MSTRSNIIIKAKGCKAILYHHYDGYIEGVGQDLVNKLDKYFNSDNYCYWSDVVNMLVKDKKDDGYEITRGIHGDIDYLYTIDTDEKTIKFQRVNYNVKGNEWKQTFGRKHDVVTELLKRQKVKERC